MSAQQLGLFGLEPVSFDRSLTALRRHELGAGAWIDYIPGFLRGHRTLYDSLLASTRFHEDSRQMYEREVTVPRLTARLPADGPGDPAVFAIQQLLGERYGEAFSRVSLALYRDGRDSVAWHGDTIARKIKEALVGSISLGSPRKFLLRPTGGGQSRSLTLGFGDLLIMGGTCQRTFQHAIPKVPSAPPRMVVMFRPVWIDPG